MRSGWKALLVGLLVVSPLGVRAELPSAATASGQDEIKKHLGEVDLYLRDAQNNAHQLYQVSELSSGGMDPALVKEELGNLDRDLTAADRHLQSARLLPSSRWSNPQSLDVLSRDLTMARSQLAGLRNVAGEKQPMRDQTVSLLGALKRADDDFAPIASSIGLARIDQVHVTAHQPARGREVDDLEPTSPGVRGPGIDRNFAMPPFPEEKRSPFRESGSPEQGGHLRY